MKTSRQHLQIKLTWRVRGAVRLFRTFRCVRRGTPLAHHTALRPVCAPFSHLSLTLSRKPRRSERHDVNYSSAKRRGATTTLPRGPRPTSDLRDWAAPHAVTPRPPPHAPPRTRHAHPELINAANTGHADNAALSPNSFN